MKHLKLIALTTTIAIGGGSAHALVVDHLTWYQDPGSWTNLPSMLFAQRQFQGFNNTNVAIGGGRWLVYADGQLSSPTDNGTGKLNYRQDNVGSSIDLSRIASMSFDIIVMGTVNLNWYLEDASGNHLGLSGAPVTLTGTSTVTGSRTVTLNFSAATIDPGFDPSTVTGMSIEISGISSPQIIAGEPAGEQTKVSRFYYTNIVPEPGTMVALGAGIAALGRRRKKA